MFLAFTMEGGPNNGMKVAVNGDHVDCVMQQENGSMIIYFAGPEEDHEKGYFNYVIVSEDFATVVSALNTAGDEMAEMLPGEHISYAHDSAQAKPGEEVDDSIEGV